jgi:hypothetical protein
MAPAHPGFENFQGGKHFEESQITHIWKVFLSSFVVVSIIISYILAFFLIWRPKSILGEMPSGVATPHQILFWSEHD